MPIRPENRALYPADWKAISKRIRYERAKNKCEQCGVRNGAIGGRDTAGEFHKAHACGETLKGWQSPELGSTWWCGKENPKMLRIIKIVLTVAHLNHDPTDCRDQNLRALCQRCHLRYDASMKKERARQRKAVGDMV